MIKRTGHARWSALAGLVLCLAGGAARAQETKYKTLDELLAAVKTGMKQESDELKRREAEFSAARDKQAVMLRDAKAELVALEKRSEGLEKAFQQNELRLGELEQTLRDRLGTMGELFGVIRQVAGDTRAQVSTSIVSAQIPEREKILEPLAQSDSLPSLEQLEQLWFVMQQEMIESGKVTRFKAPVIEARGEEKPREVVRIGAFTVVSGGQFLQYLAETGKLAELARQPAPQFLAAAAAVDKAQSGMVRAAVDPSRGSILSLLIETPTFEERVDQGGFIGYIIMGLGVVALLIAFVRFLQLAFVAVKLRMQLNNPTPKKNNPLGRVLLVYRENPGLDPETLEKKLDEAIIRETASLDRALWLIRVAYVIAPLLGLLGTVTGMIQAFQAITLFGTGDPKLMAGGISEALVTTMQGLFVAVPLVLIYAALASMSKRMVDIIDQQSAGIIATEAERQGRGQPHASAPA